MRGQNSFACEAINLSLRLSVFSCIYTFLLSITERVRANTINEITQIIAQLHKEEAPKKVKDKYLLIDQVLHYLSGGDAEPKVRLVIPKHLI